MKLKNNNCPSLLWLFLPVLAFLVPFIGAWLYVWLLSSALDTYME